jgi:Periplasmic binding protein
LRHITRVLAAVAVTGLLAAGCSRVATTSTSAGSSAPASSASAGAGSGSSIGTLSDVCHGGSATGATDQGVTSSSISLGVLTDEGFTKDPSLVNAANVFSDWCNASGGIDGRKVVPDIHDTQLEAVVSAETAACGKDFAEVGGSAALDGLGVSTRLKCLLPDFDAQEVMPQNTGAGIQISPITVNDVYAPFVGYYQWLLAKYPDSKDHVAVVWGQSSVAQLDGQESIDTVQSLGDGTPASISFPPIGLTSWTPYAEEIKSKGIKGFTFYGLPAWLSGLEQALDNIGYKVDWIDADSNAYGSDFIQGAGSRALTQQANYAPLAAVWPLEKASSSPILTKMQALYKQYAPGQPITLQAEQAWSMWLLFAVSAETCGSDLTRSCVYQAALKQTSWTGAGITAPVDEANPNAAPACFDVEQATPAGWQPATGFTPNTDGVFSCGEPAIKLAPGIPSATQLSAVGLSLSDLK